MTNVFLNLSHLEWNYAAVNPSFDPLYNNLSLHDPFVIHFLIMDDYVLFFMILESIDMTLPIVNSVIAFVKLNESSNVGLTSSLKLSMSAFKSSSTVNEIYGLEAAYSFNEFAISVKVVLIAAILESIVPSPNYDSAISSLMFLIINSKSSSLDDLFNL